MRLRACPAKGLDHCASKRFGRVEIINNTALARDFSQPGGRLKMLPVFDAQLPSEFMQLVKKALLFLFCANYQAMYVRVLFKVGN